MVVIQGRALHYVFKIGDRKATIHFYKNILGMKILRHEEFEQACEAACNGRYDNNWSKTMVGYGPEDTHFVVELVYNYPIKSYKKGNDFVNITLRNGEVLANARTHNYPVGAGNVITAPGGYEFRILDEPKPVDIDPVDRVTLSTTALDKTIDYWTKLLGMKLLSSDKFHAVMEFGGNQAKLEFQMLDTPLDRAEAHGRIAFSCPYSNQPAIDEAVKKANGTILTPLTSLDTPGKATVRVIILADPDGHEICFVDDEGFRKLSVVDPASDADLFKSMDEDMS